MDNRFYAGSRHDQYEYEALVDSISDYWMNYWRNHYSEIWRDKIRLISNQNWAKGNWANYEVPQNYDINMTNDDWTGDDWSNNFC